MAYQIHQIIEGKGSPISVTKDDTVSKALSLMIEHDYSQLPVISREEKAKDMTIDIPEGMVTNESILRGIRNFHAKIEELKIRDVMISAPVYSYDDDLFDILDRLKDSNAVLITENIGLGEDLVGIVTSYDATEYFRSRTEDMMRVEDIELIIKDFILASYTDKSGTVDESSLDDVITLLTAYKKTDKELKVDDLTLSDYINLLLHKTTWSFLEPIFSVKREFVMQLLQGVRKIRNELAHFRGDITAVQRDRLKFASEWLSKRQEEYEKLQEQVPIQKLFAEAEKSANTATMREIETVTPSFSVTEAADGGGRYAALADWLQSQPGSIDNVQLTFEEIEKNIDKDLPISARNHRAWWANDSASHSQSQQWLDAGWRRTYLNMSEEKVTFARIREREKAYISFYSKLLEEFRNHPDFLPREVSPSGTSWMIVQTLPKVSGAFSVTFTRGKRMRIELYLDTGEQDTTKDIFDKLFTRKEELEEKLGPIEWERLNNRRASRIALYRDGHILEDENHDELIKWAAETTDKFYSAFSDLTNTAIFEVLAE
ncbi:MAG: DUF4268 domain-containing protein [Anaerolineae bacterium]|jgi:predicted transcriptional regulator|nr:DUF4268 domain-containing protein [Anaerolineae bacterium]MBT7774975.1 DUF4268 domain-containing protein [Anaerolineae bacterium]